MNVFVAEDAPQVRSRLVAMVQRVPGAIVSGEAETVRETIDAVLHSHVGALLLDLQLKDGSGLEVLSTVKRERPLVRVIVLTNYATAQHRQASRAAGADAFLDKSQDFGLVPQLLREWIGDAAADASSAIGPEQKH